MTSRLKVLVVDDSPDAANSTAELLVLAGCRVRVCFDGPSALAVAEVFRPDVCLLDLTMPGMNGVELAGFLRESADYSLRLIALTGHWDIASTHQTHNAGFERHLVKPVSPRALIEAVTGQELVAA